jgi:hypothetical protein
MTIKFMEGFDSVRDNTDLTSRGWIRSTAALTTNGVGVLGMPTKTNAPSGSGVRLRGPYAAGNSVPFGAAARADFGMINTGQSVYSLWQAGGFTLGANVTFNSATQVQVGATQVCAMSYDGSQYYWAILMTSTGTYTVGYSTDLVNWTTTATQPTGLVQASSIHASGNTVFVGRGPFNLTANLGNLYYTTNQGATWTANVTATSGVRTVQATGSAATPYVFGSWDGGTYATIYYQTSLTSAATRVGTIQISTSSNISEATVSKKIGNLVFFCGWAAYGQLGPNASTTWWTWCDNTTDMTQAANWKASATLTNLCQNDITFFNNTWISVGYGGLYTAPNSATSPAIAGPLAAWTTVINTGTNVIFSVDSNSTIAVAVGQDPTNTTLGAIWTSTDGLTWTKSNRFIGSVSATSGSQGFVKVFWDGARFVIVGALNSNVIATSPDGLNWTPIYYPDYTETTQGLSGFGMFSGTAASGVFTPWGSVAGNTYGIVVSVGALSGSTRTIGAASCVGPTTFTVASTPAVVTPATGGSSTHYIEIVANAINGANNQFNFKMTIDGVLTGLITTTTTSFQLAALTDTAGTAQLFINLPRSGQIVQIDDMYLATANGTSNIGPLGAITILPHSPTGDVQDQWTPSSGSSNAAVAGVSALSNAGTKSVSTNVDAAKDVYSCNAIGANYKVLAVQAESYFSATAGTPNATVAIRSGSVEAASANSTPTTTTPVIASVFSEVDPATGAAWTTAAASSSTIALNKIS